MIIDFKAQMEPVRQAYIAARLEDGEASHIAVDMHTSEQRAWMRRHGITVTAWHGQPTYAWEHDGREYHVYPDNFAWILSCGLPGADYRNSIAFSTTCKGMFQQARTWGCLPTA